MAEPGFSEKKEKIGYFLLKMEIPHPVIEDDTLTVTHALPAEDENEAKERMTLWVMSQFPEQKAEIEKINTDKVEIVKLIKNELEYKAIIGQAEKSAK